MNVWCENAKLSDTVVKLRKGTYSEPEKIAHIRKISELSRKQQEQEKVKERCFKVALRIIQRFYPGDPKFIMLEIQR